jgi:hypothetical protein
MVWEEPHMFQEIWFKIDEERGKDFFQAIQKCLRCHEDIDMGWLNVWWGMIV